MNKKSKWRERGEIAIMIAALIAAIILGTTLLMAAIVPTTRHFDRQACNAYQGQTGRETVFVEYNFFGWDCMTPAKDGKLIPTDQLWEEVE